MHIAVTSLWILPVIRAGTAWRVVYLIVSALIHMGLSQAFCMEWVNRDPSGVDGGPLAFLTWSIPAIVGTLACDLVMSSRTQGQDPGIASLLGTALDRVGLDRELRRPGATTLRTTRSRLCRDKDCRRAR